MATNINIGRFPWKHAIILYTLSYGIVLLFLRAYFWDDWYIFASTSRSDVASLFNSRGDWPIRVLIEWDVLRGRPEVFRVLMLVTYFVSGWCLFHILKTLHFLRDDQIRFITLLFLVLPINSARVAMVNFDYAYSLMLFYMAWLIYVTRKSLIFQLFALALVVLSFSATASLMVFLVLPIAHNLYIKWLDPNQSRIRALLPTVAALLVSPVYWFADRRFNPPKEVWLQQYSLQFSGVLRAMLLVAICIMLILWYLKVWSLDLNEGNRYLLIMLGLVALVVGAIPYVVAGHLVDASEWILNFVPRASEWSSRHQLLLGLGFAVLIAGFLGELDTLFKKRIKKALVLSCVVLNFTFMHAYYLDSLKQSEFISAIADNSELLGSNVVMIDDTVIRFNARGRSIRTYEWDAMLKKAFPQHEIVSVGYGYVDCSSQLVPDAVVTITASNGRFKATLLRDIGINIVVNLSPCSM